jgi:hypothetical protein
MIRKRSPLSKPVKSAKGIVQGTTIVLFMGTQESAQAPKGLRYSIQEKTTNPNLDLKWELLTWLRLLIKKHKAK